MASGKSAWDRVGDLFQAHALAVLLLGGGIAGVTVWLATLTNFVRLFAPLSYLYAALASLILLGGLLYVIALAMRQFGWQPRRRKKRLPARDAAFSDVLRYIVNNSAYGIANYSDDLPTLAVRSLESEVIDRILEGDLALWGRVGRMPRKLLASGGLEYAHLDLAKSALVKTGDWGSTEYSDLQMSWRQVHRTWPKPSIWVRIAKRWQTKQAALTAS